MWLNNPQCGHRHAMCHGYTDNIRDYLVLNDFNDFNQILTILNQFKIHLNRVYSYVYLYLDFMDLFIYLYIIILFIFIFMSKYYLFIVVFIVFMYLLF